MRAIQDSCSLCESYRPSEVYRLNHDCRLEIFNSVIAHHPSENPNLIYALLRAHRTFEDLGTFTLAGGLRDVRRIQRAKEEQPHAIDTKGKSRAAEEEYDQPHQEKQRMLERENALGISSREQSVDSLTEIRVVPRDPSQQEAAGDVEETPSSQPLMSPTIDQATFSGFPTAVSEKARGKMPERRSMSFDTDNSVDRATATAVGRNGFVPTQEWVRILHRCVVEMATDFHGSQVTSWQQGYVCFLSDTTAMINVNLSFLDSLLTRQCW